MSDEAKIKGMGAIPHAGGVAFSVWAPHAKRVSVIGSFNGAADEWHGEAGFIDVDNNFQLEELI